MKINENGSAKLPTHLIIPVLAFVVGAVFFYIGFFSYGFWDSAAVKPTKGFFPVIIAVLLMAVSVLSFVQGLKKKEWTEFHLYNWFVPIALLLIVAVSYLIGLVLAVIVFEFLWLKVYEKQSWKTFIIVLLIVLFLIVGCFQMWLGIDFPKGIILDAILG